MVHDINLHVVLLLVHVLQLHGRSRDCLGEFKPEGIIHNVRLGVTLKAKNRTRRAAVMLPAHC